MAHLMEHPFLSTLSLRRATNATRQVTQTCQISIHALLAESDPPRVVRKPATGRFLSTLPCGERPFEKFEGVIAIKISIHALLAESDNPGGRAPSPPRHFYPRSPCGERPPRGRFFFILSPISIHALLAESDFVQMIMSGYARISIHALLAESDPAAENRCTRSKNFYPRSPCGERHNPVAALTSEVSISIHALLAESDLPKSYLFPLKFISIHALLAESDYGFGWEV